MNDRSKSQPRASWTIRVDPGPPPLEFTRKHHPPPGGGREENRLMPTFMSNPTAGRKGVLGEKADSKESIWSNHRRRTSTNLRPVGPLILHPYTCQIGRLGQRGVVVIFVRGQKGLGSVGILARSHTMPQRGVMGRRVEDGSVRSFRRSTGVGDG